MTTRKPRAVKPVMAWGIQCNDGSTLPQAFGNRERARDHLFRDERIIRVQIVPVTRRKRK